MVKHRKWLDLTMIVVATLVIITTIIIISEFIYKIPKLENNSSSDFVNALAFVIILMTFMSATILLIPVVLYLLKSYKMKLTLENINNHRPVSNLKFPYTQFLLVTLYICVFITILISTTSFEVMIEGILTRDEVLYSIRAAVSIVQNITVSLYIIFIIDYLKNKVIQEKEIKELINYYNGENLNYNLRKLDNVKLDLTINLTRLSCLIFFIVFVFRLVDASLSIMSGGNLLNGICTIVLYLEVLIFFSLGVGYFKTERNILNEINSIIERINLNNEKE